MNIRQALESRWPPGWDKTTRNHPARITFIRAMDAHDKVRAKHAAVSNDKDLTPLGRQNRIREFIGKEVAPEIRRGQKAVEAMRAGLEQWRARLQPKIDKTDAAAAVLRSEYRSMLREMRAGERAAFVMQPDVDSVMISAILEVPTYVTNLPGDVRDRLLSTQIEREHPGQLAAIEAAEEIVTLVKAGVDSLVMTSQAAGEFASPHEFSFFVGGSAGQRAAAIDQAVHADFAAWAEAA